MSIATQITRLQTAKADIKTAIQAKGVSVPISASLAVYDEYIAQIPTGGGSSWTRPSDWPIISDCGTNEIFLLAGDMCLGLAFSTIIASSGTYSIDWGDGTIETGRSSGVTYQHQYTLGSGTPCSEGYTTFKVRIFDATNTITRFLVQKTNFANRNQYSPVLDAWIGATGITNYSNMFYQSNILCYFLKSATIASFASATGSLQYIFGSCINLESVSLPNSWGSTTGCNYMFYGCSSLRTVSLPSSWSSVTLTNAMFQGCTALESVSLPNSWGVVNNVSYMFANCQILRSVSLPNSWGVVTTTSNMFDGCYNLINLTLPPISSNALINCNSMFVNCYFLKNLINVEYLGSQTALTTMTTAFAYCEMLSSLSISAKLSIIGVNGHSSYKNKITSIRLTNTASTFTGSAPQVDVSYCDLSATALNQLFTDLPTLTGKTIKITGCTGAATCDTSIPTAKGWTCVI